MAAARPRHCRPHAYDLFAAQVARIGSRDALWKGAVAISMHALEGVELADVDERLQDLAERIRGRVRSGEERALLAHAHQVLFEEEGFTGNRESYHDPCNSYLPIVLETRRGLPISLALVYKTVVERLDLRVHGINAPGHFLAAVEVAGGGMLVDPFSGGRVMTKEEAYRRMEEATRATIPRSDRLLEPADNRTWLARMLRNLQAVFRADGNAADFHAMRELARLLGE